MRKQTKQQVWHNWFEWRTFAYPRTIGVDTHSQYVMSLAENLLSEKC